MNSILRGNVGRGAGRECAVVAPAFPDSGRTTAGGVLALLEHPEQAESLRNDPSLTKPAVEEFLRYTCPVEMATERYAREKVEIKVSFFGESRLWSESKIYHMNPRRQPLDRERRGNKTSSGS